jgi:hypothetical protein
MVLSEYRTAVQNVNVEYGKINVASEDSACVSKVGVPTETALNEYSAALRSWNDCVTDMACGKTVLHDLVQGHWSTASGKVAEAKEGMQTLKVADSWSS